MKGKLWSDLSGCIQCGTCTGGCPVAYYDGEFNPRKIIAALMEGVVDDITGSQVAWLCGQCHVCSDRCPREIPVSEIMLMMKAMTVVPGTEQTKQKTISSSGFLVPVTQSVQKLKEKFALPGNSGEQVANDVRRLWEQAGGKNK